MHYLITGVDAPGFGSPEEINATHQDYMDSWASRLIARGPSLSADGTHSGSVHVVDLPDLAAAQEFAHKEPYAMAGWYSTVTISPIWSCFEGTMWDRPAPTGPIVSALVSAKIINDWSPAPDLARDLGQQLAKADHRCAYAGVICNDDTGAATGLIAVFDHDPDTAQERFESVLKNAHIPIGPVHTSRWRRGGRNAPGYNPGNEGSR